MQQQRVAEISVGVFILLGLFALFMLALKVSGLSDIFSPSGYLIQSRFENTGDLKIHAPVTVAGVSIGYVKKIQLDQKTYNSIVTLSIDHTIHLPKDSSASIFTQGLLGSNYIELTPGFDTQMLKSNDVILETHSAVILEHLIGQLIFNGKDKDKK